MKAHAECYYCCQVSVLKPGVRSEGRICEIAHFVIDRLLASEQILENRPYKLSWIKPSHW